MPVPSRLGRAKEQLNVDLFVLMRTVLRRYYVFLPIAVLAVVTAITVSGTVAPEYTSTGSGILVGPRTTTLGDGEEMEVNPYLTLSSSMSIAAEILQRVMSGPETKAVVHAEGLSTNYVVTAEKRSPIVVVTATSSSATTSRETVERLLELMRQDLLERQGPTDLRITLETLTEPATSFPSNRGAQRVKVMVLGAGLAAAVVASVGFDAMVARRRAATAWSAVDAEVVDHTTHRARPAERDEVPVAH